MSKQVKSRVKTRVIKKPSTLPLIVAALTALVLSFGLLLGLQYVGTPQDIRQQASSVQPVRLRLHGQTVTGGELRIDFLLNTGIHTISGAQVAAKITGASPNEMSLDMNNSLGLERLGSKLSVRNDGAYLEFTQFAPLDSSRLVSTNNQEIKIASLTIKRSQGGTFTLSMDGSTAVPVTRNPSVQLDYTREQSFTLAAGGTNVTPNPGIGSKKSCNQNCASDTECSSNYCYKGQCRLAENREDSFCRGVGDKGLNRACNEYCADKNECASGYSCYYNRCRNPRNITSDTCSNPPSPRPVTNIGTSRGSTRVTPRPSVAPTPSPSPSPTPSVSATPSPVMSPSPSPNIYDEDAFRISPSPATLRATPTPSPTAVTEAQGPNRALRAGLILLFALGIVIPVGVYLYRRVR